MEEGGSHNDRALNQRVASRERILDACAVLVRENGFASVGVEQIINEALVSKSTFYNQFGSKDGLFESLVRREFDDLRSLCGPELAAFAGDGARARLVGFFDLIERRRRNGNMLLVSPLALASFGDPRDPVRVAAEEVTDAMRSSLKSMFEEWTGRDGRVPHRFLAYWALVREGLMSLEPRPDLKPACEALLDEWEREGAPAGGGDDDRVGSPAEQ